MNMSNKSLLKGINYSINTSVLITFIGTNVNSLLFNSYQDFITIFLFMSVIISAITLFISVLFGTFIVLLLEGLNIEGYTTTTIFGGLLGSLVGFLAFSDWTLMVLIFCFYGACCGFAFSYGYNKEVISKK